MNFVYKWLMTSKSHNLNYEFEKLIRTIEVYNLLCSDEDKNESIVILDYSNNEYKVFKDVTDTKTSYNLFIGNIHIRMDMSAKENVYSVHIKKHTDDWEFSKVDGVVNHSTPITHTYRIYVYYDVPVLNITRAIGSSYINGAWDKYVYNTITSLINDVNKNTEMSQFNKAYKK